MNHDLDVFVAKRDEIAQQLEAAVAALEPLRQAAKESAETALAAGRRYNAISTRILYAQRPDDETAPALFEILNDARKVRDATDAAHTRAKNALANAEWAVSCLNESLTQVERVINPPPMGGALREVVKRPLPGPQTVELIQYPPGHPAGEAA